jgi:hypothetical protein
MSERVTGSEPALLRGGRRASEGGLRLGAAALLVWGIARALAGVQPGGPDTVSAGDLRRRLPAWTVAPPPGGVHVRLDASPAAADRDWLAALGRAGVVVTWTNAGVAPLAVVSEPLADPRGGALVAVAAPAGARAELADDAGPLDTVVTRGVGGIVRLARLDGGARVRSGATVAGASVRDSIALRRVLVLGRAGWEAKFVLAALEERGWATDARLVVAPRQAVVQGGYTRPDTATYAAVVALDSAGVADVAAAVARYVRGGGGVVLAGDAARVPALAGLAPGTARSVERAPGRDSVGRETLPLAPLTALRPDAVVLERRGARVVTAARRAGAGRVVQTGLAESWRWRLAGGDEAPGDHRAWWSGIITAVAYAPAVARVPAAGALDAAPLAHLVAALGAPAAETAPLAPRRAPLPAWLAVAILLLLLAEWTSRRLRGAP